MKAIISTWLFFFAILFLLPLHRTFPQSNTQVVRTISYTEILNAQIQPIAGIERMRISANGSKIAFNTYAGKLYSINSDGTGLTELMSENGRGFLDISADGSTIIFSNLFGYEILVFNSAGGAPAHIANNLPIPGGGTTGPDIRLNPVIADSCSPSGIERRIYFAAVAGGIDVAGVWYCMPDGTDLHQAFSYHQMSQSLFGLDGSEFNGNIALRMGFDASENGQRVVVGTLNFQAEGHIILWDEFNGISIFKNFGTAPSDNECGLTIDNHGNKVVMSKALTVLGAGIIAVDVATGTETELIENVGTSPFIQMTVSGSKVFAKGDSYPLMIVNTDASEILEIVNSPSLVSGSNPFYRACIGPTISVTSDGKRFAFVSALNYNDYTRTWVADISNGAASSTPAISNVNLIPNYVVVNGGSTSTFEASITGGTILVAGFTGFKDGVFESIIGQSNSYLLWDDGTHGDSVANNNIYTCEGVYTSIQNNPSPNDVYSIRFSAATEHNVTAIDVKPFYIYNSPLGIETKYKSEIPANFILKQNYPNPFNSSTIVEFGIPQSGFVSIKIYDILGNEIATLLNDNKQAGTYQIRFNADNLASGIYFYQLNVNGFTTTKKMVLLL